ncbi:MAG: alpha/beta fold hydrolase [Planctomycetes bacterium]|nr:alpha/beta fold hydrolase [Planctomycetota bacterium]MCW8136125.1 alpha/beta fold hydrolase [Planctomycetota bacterium]
MRALAALCLIVLAALAAHGQEAPAYKPPADARFTTSEVSIPVAAKDGAKAWAIAASLNVPKGEVPEGGWPAVFFISGSGIQDRHGMAGGMDIGTWEVLDAIANAGFVVLRADDRATGGTPIGPEGIDPREIGYHALVEDARVCVKWLRAHESVNKAKVFLVGHSEGGITAPILAGESLCAGVVFMAAPGRNMYDVIYEQVKDANAGLPAITRTANLKVQKEFQDAVKEGREPNYAILGKQYEANLKQLWQTQIEPGKKWMHEHYNLDIEKIHATVACPVFVAQGEADFQVKAVADGRQLAKNLLAGKCSDVTFRLYADLDHLFKACNGKPSTLEMYKEKRAVDATFLKDLVQWLTARA